MALPPNDKTAKKHWQDQEPSIDRPLGSRDPGVVQVDCARDIERLVEQESAGLPTPVYRARTARNVDDPVARSTALIRSVTQRGITSEQFYAQVETTEDLLLQLCLFGDMEDGFRAANLHKLSKLLWDKQKEVLKQNNIDRNLEEKRVRNAVELDRKLAKLAKSGMLDAALVEPKSEKDGDV